MKVRDLIKALERCPSDATVEAFNVADQNQFSVHVVTYCRLHRQLLLAADDSEMAISESVLHRDLTEADGQFGVGA